MRQFLFAAVAFAFTATPAVAAEDPKTPPPTAAELKKQIADLEAFLAAKTKERDLAESLVKAAAAEHDRIRKAEFVKVKELQGGLEKSLREISTKANESRATARKAEEATAAAARALAEANEQLKAATDADEIATLKKKVAELETVLAEKKELAAKTQTVAKAAVEEVKKFTDEARAKIAAAQNAADAAAKDPLADVVKARERYVKLCDELDTAAIKLRRAKDQLENLKK